MKFLAMLCLLAALAAAAPAQKDARPPKPEAKTEAKKDTKKEAKKDAKKPAASEEEDEAASAAEFESQLNFQRGRIALPGGIATLSLSDGYRYLAPDDAERVLVEAWGNPPGAKTLGMIFPADLSPLAEEGWGVVISYVEEGHVSDADAAEIDYDELLKGMKEATAEENRERRRQGYDPVTLVGWAAPPRYEAAAHKLYWARELKFDGADANSLNYDVRVLGRKGVLSFNAVGVMDQLPQIESGMREVMAFAEFNPGHRYADFDSKVDDVAAYGLGALVAGKVAAKAGFFKLLLGLLAAGKKFIIIGVIALAVLLKKLLWNKRPAQ